MKSTFLCIDNMKKPACASKQDVLVLATLQFSSQYRIYNSLLLPHWAYLLCRTWPTFQERLKHWQWYWLSMIKKISLIIGMDRKTQTNKNLVPMIINDKTRMLLPLKTRIKVPSRQKVVERGPNTIRICSIPKPPT